MPREHDMTSVDETPSASSDPFRARAAGPDDTAPVDDITAAGTPVADGADTVAAGTPVTDGADTVAANGDAPDGKTASAGASGAAPEGEWVAGSRGPSVPSQPYRPAVEDAGDDPGAGRTSPFGEEGTPVTDAEFRSAADTTPAVDADSDPSVATTPGSAGAGAGLDAVGAAFVADADGYRASWVRIQSAFVDDPRGSVTEAADLIAQITGTLLSAVQERERSLRGGWDSEDADTEVLRNVLREYRSFFERLMKV